MVEVDSVSTSALHIVLNRGAEVTLLKCKLHPRFHKNLRSPKWFSPCSPKWFSPCHFPSLPSSSAPSAMPASLFLPAQQAWLHLPVFALAASPAWNALPPFSSLAFAQKLSQGGLPWSPYWKTSECFKPHPLFLLYFPRNNSPSNTLQTLLSYLVDCTTAHWNKCFRNAGFFFPCFSSLLNLWLLELCLAYTDSVRKCWIDKWMNG